MSFAQTAEKTIKEVDYLCATPKCEHTQTIRFSPDEPVFPVTNCVKCRAGFGIDLQQQMAERIGMFPVGKARFSH